MKKRIMMLTLFCIIVSLTVAGNAKEVLFEDYFEGDSLGDHWNVVLDRDSVEGKEVPAEYYVKDGNLVVDFPLPLGAYIDLEGYSFTGDFTVEIKFNFSSERTEGYRHFGLWTRRPEDPDMGWLDLPGHFIAWRFPPRQDIAFFEVLPEGDLIAHMFPLDLILLGRDVYPVDKWFVLKIVSKDNVHFLYLDGEEITDLGEFESGLETWPQEHGGFSLQIYDSIMSFDYIKIYR